MNCNNCGSELKPFTKFCTKCGHPAPQPAQAAYTPPVNQPSPTWGVGAEQAPPYQPRKKSRVGKVLLIVFTVLLILGAGVGAAVYFGIRALRGNLQSSEAYRVADTELRRNNAVRERLGEIRETGFPLGTYKENPDGTGNAAYTTSVQGSTRNGRYVVTLERESGTWRVTNGFVKVDGTDEMINIGNDSSPSLPVVEPAEPAAPATPPSPGSPPRPPVSGGVMNWNVLNGKAISKPTPAYPSLAKAARAQGTVTVFVTVDESGDVTSAKAAAGHPLLQQAAVQAARQAKLSPTLLSGKPVKVSGVLTYNFTLQ